MFTASVKRRNSGNFRKIQKGLRGPKKVKVGLPSGKADGDIISIGIWNHFGTSRGIPPRPFLANAVRNNKTKYLAGMKRSARQILLGTTSITTTLNKLGALAQGDIQAEITALRTPPNAPSTIKQKGSSNPLIDTGQLRQSITWKVDN